jgi:hypothetical protein
LKGENMAGQIPAIAIPALAPVVMNIAGSALRTSGISNPSGLLGLSNAFSNVFGQPQSFSLGMPSQLPVSMPDALQGDPLSALQSSSGAFQNALPDLSATLALFTDSSLAGTADLTSDAIAATAGGDALMRDAYKVLSDPNSTDDQKIQAQETISNVDTAIKFASAMIARKKAIEDFLLQHMA